MKWTKDQLVAIIGAALVAVFVAVWSVLLWQVWNFVPTDDTPELVFGDGTIIVAGTLATTVGSLTAAALGFSIADVKSAARTSSVASAAGEAPTAMTAREIGRAVGTGVAWAVLAYLLVGVLVLLVYLLKEDVAPEFFSAYALSAVGWILGGGATALRSPSPTTEEDGDRGSP